MRCKEILRKKIAINTSIVIFIYSIIATAFSELINSGQIHSFHVSPFTTFRLYEIEDGFSTGDEIIIKGFMGNSETKFTIYLQNVATAPGDVPEKNSIVNVDLKLSLFKKENNSNETSPATEGNAKVVCPTPIQVHKYFTVNIKKRAAHYEVLVNQHNVGDFKFHYDLSETWVHIDQKFFYSEHGDSEAEFDENGGITKCENVEETVSRFIKEEEIIEDCNKASHR